jgi:hypothetical protein
MSKAKPFCISKQEVWEAYKRVKANKGAAGVDEQSCNGPIFSSSSKAKFFSLSPGCTAAIAKPGRVAL